jgi:hypothetical protein
VKELRPNTPRMTCRLLRSDAWQAQGVKRRHLSKVPPTPSTQMDCELHHMNHDIEGHETLLILINEILDPYPTWLSALFQLGVTSQRSGMF